jgi:hypothetical protein
MSSATKWAPLTERVPNPDFEEFARDCIVAGFLWLRSDVRRSENCGWADLEKNCRDA